MKIVLFIFFAFISVFAQSEETCYTVQLTSSDNTEKNLHTLQNNNYPQSCEVMQIGESITVRCGCFEKKSLAQERQTELKKEYPNAAIVNTYRYRFDAKVQKAAELSTVEKIILSPKIPKKDVSKSDADKAKESKETCYTVQLVSVNNTSKNLDVLSKSTFPQNCKAMEIGNTLTVRCGCFEKISLANDEQKVLQKEYRNAAVVSTYKYRFDEETIFESSREKKEDKEEKEGKSKVTIAREESSQKEEKKGSEEKKDKAVSRLHEEKIEAVEQEKNFVPADLAYDDEELRLMMQVFLGKGDLESAYEVASKGYSKTPHSYYWNQKMAEICQWTNRSARSMKHLRFMYEVKYDPKIEQELIEYGSESYQYEEIEPLVVNRALREPTEKNIDLMILVYKEIGEPEKVVKVLETQYYKDTTNTILLTKALELSLEIGNMELVQKFVNILEQKKPYTKKDASLIARYYYITNEIATAYKSLLETDESKIVDEQENIKYYQLKSDLGWYLQENVNAAAASRYLMEIEKARFVDYERISFVYQKKDPEFAAGAVKKAYREHKISYLFYSFANEAINLKQYDVLNALIEEFDAEETPFEEESLYWIIKSKVYAYYEKRDLEKEALLKALELDPENYQIKLALLWFFMDISDAQNVRMILTDMSENKELGASFYLPIASAYFYLHDINRASYYTQQLLAMNDSVIELTQFKFLQAYIYQIQNNEPAFMSYMNKIVSDLKEEAELSPGLEKQDEHLSNYLRAGMHVWHPDKFENKLAKAKEYLSEENYNEIAYSWAVNNSAYEKSFKIYHKMNKKELWVRFSNDTIAQDHTGIENLMDWYLESLSMGDVSQASYKDGQKALSQTITFEGLLTNDDNQNAYIQHRDLSKERSDLFETKLAHSNRDPLVQKSSQLQNRAYLQKGYYLYTGFDYFSNSTLNERLLQNVPQHTLEADMGLRKIYDRGYLEGHVEFHDSMESYLGFSLLGHYQWSTDIITDMAFAKNANATEATQLLLGGKKDMLSLNLLWNFLDSTSFEVLYEQSRYASQDGVHLGNGAYTRYSLNRQIRNGYPDMRVGLFHDVGRYNEQSDSKGVIDKLQIQNNPVLPENFANIGLSFAYGMANAEAYTRVWRPYFEFYPYYNKTLGDYTYGAIAGYGGKVWHQDHMSVGASYTDSVNGVGGNSFELFLKYQFMYYHP
ncbi:MAG: tetratricopeptide repeat protein [Sulfurimonas sp.]|nr:tetratricopeptide repeat protein [Sulfurimonas sp.]